MWSNTTPLGEIVVRVLLVYAALLLMVRLSGKREIGALGPLDLLGMLLLSETVAPALTGQDGSLIAALVAAASLLVAVAVVGRLTYWSPKLERLVDGTPREIVTSGTLNQEACEGERISSQELASSLRREGVDSIAEVRRATLETNGQITVVPQRGPS